MSLDSELSYCVLLTCHNRAENTVQAVQSAARSAAELDRRMHFVIVDDGSTDGTAAALEALGLAMTVVRADGSYFWAKGMRTAEDRALALPEAAGFTHLVWLNDDVVLDEMWLDVLEEGVRTDSTAIIVGAMRDPLSGITTYSGVERAGAHPLSYQMVEPDGTYRKVDTFNGNLVLVPIASARAIGGIDGDFSHAFADIDYGIRASQAGIDVLLAPVQVGSCSRNAPKVPGSLHEEWTNFIGVKGGGNFRSLKRILRKSHPRAWPFIVSATYGKWWVKRLPNRFLRWRST